MVEITVVYEGDLHCNAQHGPSKTMLQTDAPVDNQGRGESFSPTDLVATALGTCMATLMGIYAKRHAIDLQGMRVSVKKEMRTEPRRIGKLEVVIDVPAGVPDAKRKALEQAALSCPVHASLHPDIAIPVVFNYR